MNKTVECKKKSTESMEIYAQPTGSHLFLFESQVI